MATRPRCISLRTNSGVMKARYLSAEAFASAERGFRTAELLLAAEILAPATLDHPWCDAGAANSSWVMCGRSRPRSGLYAQ